MALLRVDALLPNILTRIEESVYIVINRSICTIGISSYVNWKERGIGSNGNIGRNVDNADIQDFRRTVGIIRSISTISQWKGENGDNADTVDSMDNVYNGCINTIGSIF